MRFIKKLLLAALGLSVVLPLTAQEAQESFPRVNDIRIEFDGFQGASDQFVRSNIQLRSGMNFNPSLVDQSIRSLYGTDRFEFVEVKVEPAAGGQVDVVFELVSKYTLGRIEYQGNEAYSDSRLASKGELSTGGSLDEFNVSVAAGKIRDYYVEKGYPDVTVDYRIERDGTTGYATAIFEIEEGERVKITDISFTGNDTFKVKRLRKEMQTKTRNWLSWLTGTGRFDDAQFQEDLARLRTFYRNQGFLDVVVDESKVDITFPRSGRMQINIHVVEGERYYLGEMSVQNATIFTSGELLSAVKILPGEPFSPAAVDDAASAVREYYTSRGYLDAGVRAERVPNMETRRIDVVFRVRESEKFYVESIKVEGNTKTKTRVILRELALRPGDVFDLTRMETSERRLQNTRYFEDVRLNPETINVAGRRDLGITVREGRTGNFSFGAGFGSVERAVIFFEMTQGNFDLFNWRSRFQGAGQKFRFRASMGTRSNEIIIAFEEPWLFEQRLAFGVELFRRESQFQSADFNELRTGMELYLRRRLFELVEGRLSYRLELVKIFDVRRDDTMPVDETGATPGDGFADVFQAAEGEDVISKVGFSLLRDTRDTLMFTRRGNRTTLISEIAGLGGDVNYLRLEARTAHFIPTFDTLEQTLSIIGRIGSVAPYGKSDSVPFYDRYYLGGPDTLRGFDYRDVGPRDADDEDESVGGNTYGMISFEYQFRLAEPLALVVFYDWGYVNEDRYDFSPSGYADNWGVGARVLLMGSPLKLDLGIPITKPDGTSGGTQFNFSFGTRF